MQGILSYLGPSQFLEIVNDLLPHANWWVQSPTPNHLLYQVLTLSHHSPALNHPRDRQRVRGQTTGNSDSPVCQSLLTSFKLANLKPADTASSILSCRNHGWGSCPHFSSPYLLKDPRAPLCGPPGVRHSQLSGPVSKKLSFQRQPSPALSTSPYLDNNTYILNAHPIVLQSVTKIVVWCQWPTKWYLIWVQGSEKERKGIFYPSETVLWDLGLFPFHFSHDHSNGTNNGLMNIDYCNAGWDKGTRVT